MQADKSNLNKITAASLLVALGIIYVDIGTSPLYVLSAMAEQIDKRMKENPRTPFFQIAKDTI